MAPRNVVLNTETAWQQAALAAAHPRVFSASQLNFNPADEDMVRRSWGIQQFASDIERAMKGLGFTNAERPRRAEGPDINPGESLQSWQGRRTHEEAQAYVQRMGLPIGPGSRIQLPEAEAPTGTRVGTRGLTATMDLFNPLTRVGAEIKPDTFEKAEAKYSHQWAAELLSMGPGSKLYVYNYGDVKQLLGPNGQPDPARVAAHLEAHPAREVTLEYLRAKGIDVGQRMSAIEDWRAANASQAAIFTPNRPYNRLTGLGVREQSALVWDAWREAGSVAAASSPFNVMNQPGLVGFVALPAHAGSNPLDSLNLAGISTGLSRRETAAWAERHTGRPLAEIAANPDLLSSTIQALNAERIPRYEGYRAAEIKRQQEAGGQGEGVMSPAWYASLTEFTRQALTLGVPWSKLERDQYGKLVPGQGYFGKPSTANAIPLSVLEAGWWPRENGQTVIDTDEKKVLKRTATMGKHPLWTFENLPTYRGFKAGPAAVAGDEFQVARTFFLQPTRGGGANISPAGTGLVRPELGLLTNRVTKDVPWDAAHGEEPVPLTPQLAAALANNQPLMFRKGEAVQLGQGLQPFAAPFDLRVLDAQEFQEGDKTGRRYLLERVSPVAGFGKVAYGPFKFMALPSQNLNEAIVRNLRGERLPVPDVMAETKSNVGMAYLLTQTELTLAREGAQLPELRQQLGAAPDAPVEALRQQIATELGYESWASLPQNVAEMGRRPLKRLATPGIFERYAAEGLVPDTIHVSNKSYYEGMKVGDWEPVAGRPDYVRFWRQGVGLQGLSGLRVMPEYDPDTPNFNLTSQQQLSVDPANAQLLADLRRTGSRRLLATRALTAAMGMTESTEPLAPGTLQAGDLAGWFGSAITRATAWAENPLEQLPGMTAGMARRLHGAGIDTYEDLANTPGGRLRKLAGKGADEASMRAWKEQAAALAQAGPAQNVDPQAITQNLLDILSHSGTQKVGGQLLNPATRPIQFGAGSHHVVVPDLAETVNYFRTPGKYAGQEGSGLGNAIGAMARSFAVGDPDEVKAAAIERARAAMQKLTSGQDLTKRATSLQSELIRGHKILPSDLLATGTVETNGRRHGMVEAYFPEKQLQGTVGYAFGSPTQASSFDPGMAVKFLTEAELLAKPGQHDPTRAYVPTVLAQALARDYDGDIVNAMSNGALDVNEQGELYNKQTGEVYNNAQRVQDEAKRMKREGAGDLGAELRGPMTMDELRQNLANAAEPVGPTNKRGLRTYSPAQMGSAMEYGSGMYGKMGRLYNPTSKVRAAAYDRFMAAEGAVNRLRGAGTTSGPEWDAAQTALGAARQGYAAASRFHGQPYNVVQRPEELGPVMRQMETILTGMNLSGTTGDAAGEGATRLGYYRGWSNVRQASVAAWTRALRADQESPEFVRPEVAAQLLATPDVPAAQLQKEFEAIARRDKAVGTETRAVNRLSQVLPGWQTFHQSLFGEVAYGQAYRKWQSNAARGESDEAVIRQKLAAEAQAQGLTPEREAEYRALATRQENLLAATGPIGLNRWALSRSEAWNRLRAAGQVEGAPIEGTLKGHFINPFEGATPLTQAIEQLEAAFGPAPETPSQAGGGDAQVAAGGNGAQPPVEPPVATAAPGADPGPRREGRGAMWRRAVRNASPEQRAHLLRQWAYTAGAPAAGTGGGPGGGGPRGPQISKTWSNASFQQVQKDLALVKEWWTLNPQGFDETAPMQGDVKAMHGEFSRAVGRLERAMGQLPGSFAESDEYGQLEQFLPTWQTERTAIQQQMGMDTLNRGRARIAMHQYLSGVQSPQQWQAMGRAWEADPLGMTGMAHARFGQYGAKMATAMRGLGSEATEAQRLSAMGAMGDMAKAGAVTPEAFTNFTTALKDLTESAKKNTKAFNELYDSMRPEDKATYQRMANLVNASNPAYWERPTQEAAKFISGIEGAPGQDRAKMIQQLAGMSGTKTGLREAGGNIMDELAFGWTAFRMRMAWNLATGNQRQWMGQFEEQQQGLTAAAFQLGAQPGQTMGMSYLGAQAQMQNAQARWGRGVAEVLNPVYQAMGSLGGTEQFGAMSTIGGYGVGLGIGAGYLAKLLGGVLGATNTNVGAFGRTLFNTGTLGAGLVKGAGTIAGITTLATAGALLAGYAQSEGRDWYKDATPETTDIGDHLRRGIRIEQLKMREQGKAEWQWVLPWNWSIGSSPEVRKQMALEKASWQPGNLAFDMDRLQSTLAERYKGTVPEAAAAGMYAALGSTAGLNVQLTTQSAQVQKIFDEQFKPYIQAGIPAEQLFNARMQTFAATGLPMTESLNWFTGMGDLLKGRTEQRDQYEQTIKLLAGGVAARGRAYTNPEIEAYDAFFRQTKSAAGTETLAETVAKVGSYARIDEDYLRRRALGAGAMGQTPEEIQRNVQLQGGAYGIGSLFGYALGTDLGRGFEQQFAGWGGMQLDAFKEFAQPIAQVLGQYGQAPTPQLVSRMQGLVTSRNISMPLFQQFLGMQGTPLGQAFNQMARGGNVMNAFGGGGWQYAGMEYSPTMGYQEIGTADMWSRSVAMNRAQNAAQIASIQGNLGMLALQQNYNAQMRPLEDASIAANRGYQLTQLAFARQGAAQSYRQSLESIGLSEQEFRVRTRQQEEDMGLQGHQLARRRQWMEEDYAYQESMSGLQFGWQMEDLDRAIRLSSGRERQNLRRQRERAQITYGMQEGQRGREHERNEEQAKWADDAFKRQKKNNQELIHLQEQGFQMQRRHLAENYELQQAQFAAQEAHMREMWGLEDQQRKLQRAFQDEQLKHEQGQMTRQLALAKQAAANYEAQVAWEEKRHAAAKALQDEIYGNIAEGGKLREGVLAMFRAWDAEITRMRNAASAGNAGGAQQSDSKGSTNLPSNASAVPPKGTPPRAPVPNKKMSGEQNINLVVKLGEKDITNLLVAEIVAAPQFARGVGKMARNERNRVF